VKMFKTLGMVNTLLIGMVVVLGLGYVVGSEVSSIWGGETMGTHTKDVFLHLGEVVPVWFSNAVSGISNVMEDSIALSVGAIAGVAVFFVTSSWVLIKRA